MKNYNGSNSPCPRLSGLCFKAKSINSTLWKNIKYKKLQKYPTGVVFHYQTFFSSPLYLSERANLEELMLLVPKLLDETEDDVELRDSLKQPGNNCWWLLKEDISGER